MMVRPIYLLILRGVGRCGGITGWEVLCTSLCRGVRGHAPPENFENMDTLRRILVHSRLFLPNTRRTPQTTNFINNIKLILPLLPLSIIMKCEEFW